MKKIINNRLYNTETAKYLGSDDGGEGFTSWSETLYQKRNGEFFLHGEGGARTKYAVTIGDNSWSGGEKIIPITAATAREWAEEHLDADTYAEIFGLPSEGEDTAALNIQLDAQLMARIRAQAAAEGITLTACVSDLLKKALA